MKTEEVTFQLMTRKSSTVESELELLHQIDDGLPISALEKLIADGMLNEPELFYFISKRTLSRRKGEKRLNPEESDLLVRIARIYGFATEIFGSKEKANTWLRTSNHALRNSLPLDLLRTDLGARVVETILGRIDHGIYS